MMNKAGTLAKRLGSLKASAQNLIQDFRSDERPVSSHASAIRPHNSADTTATTTSPAGPSGQPGRQPSGALSYGDRVAKFTEVLAAEYIDLTRLRTLAKDGVPDTDGLRALTWKVSGVPVTHCLAPTAELQSHSSVVECG
jgi:hypothetical protein